MGSPSLRPRPLYSVNKEFWEIVRWRPTKGQTLLSIRLKSGPTHMQPGVFIDPEVTLGFLDVIDCDLYHRFSRRAHMRRTAKLFRNGRTQAVRPPSEFRFEGGEVFIRQDPETGDVILSRRPDSWQSFLLLLKKPKCPRIS